MSSDIYAKPDFSKKVRYNRKVQEDNVEWEERTVAIYESTDDIRDDHTDLQSQDGGPHTENHPPAVQSRPFRAAAFCLGVLCFLTITGIILLYIRYISVTSEKDQLQTRYDKLNNNYSELQGQISEKWCPEGWKRFGCSCYFKSNEEKTWYYSRSDCQEKGADLVIINNKEEQKFVIELNKDGDSWIGLWVQTGRKWKWVDDSPLTELFWATGHPHSNYYAACCDKQGNWTTSRYNDKKNWICEK